MCGPEVWPPVKKQGCRYLHVPAPRLLDLSWTRPCHLIGTPPLLAAHAPIKGGSAFLCKRGANLSSKEELRDPVSVLLWRAAGLRLSFTHTSSQKFSNFSQNDCVGRGDALLPPTQARRGLQRPTAHCHPGLRVLSGQLPAHLAWDPWPLGKGVLKVLRGVLEAHVVGVRELYGQHFSETQGRQD